MTPLLETIAPPRPPRRAPDLRREARALPGYEVVGAPAAPLIVALGGISATRHVTATPLDASEGWWESTVGSGRAIDTNRFRVLSIDYLDGGRRHDGRPRRTITTHDQADAVAAVLDHLGVARVHAFVGASYGGMVALAFAERHPERLDRLVVISAPHESHPMSTALRSIQRSIVKLGVDTGEADRALAIARGLAMTTYRSAREFAERFAPVPTRLEENDATFPVEAYLDHHGRRFADRWAAERFLALSLSADLHRVNPSAIRTPTVIVAAEGDTIVPGEQLEQLAGSIDAPTRLVQLASTRGHDAFLTEAIALGNILEVAISTTLVQ